MASKNVTPDLTFDFGVFIFNQKESTQLSGQKSNTEVKEDVRGAEKLTLPESVSPRPAKGYSVRYGVYQRCL